MSSLRLLFLDDGCRDFPSCWDGVEAALARVLASVAFRANAREKGSSEFCVNLLEGWHDVLPATVDTETLQANMYTKGDVAIVAFRGTYNVTSWARNCQVALVPLGAYFGKDLSGCMVHYGFQMMAKNIISQFEREGLFQHLLTHLEDESPDRVLYCVGHSLGGVLALFFALYFARLRESSQIDRLRVVGFGSPRVGNAQFNELCRQRIGRISWLANPRDLAPRVPPLRGYEHVVQPDVLQGHREELGSDSTLDRLASLRFLLAVLTQPLSGSQAEQHACITYWDLLFDEGMPARMPSRRPWCGQLSLPARYAPSISQEAKATLGVINLVLCSAGMLNTVYGLRCVRSDVESLLEQNFKALPRQELTVEVQSVMLRSFEEAKMLLDSRICSIERDLERARKDFGRSIESCAASICFNFDIQAFTSLTAKVRDLDLPIVAGDARPQQRLGQIASQFDECFEVMSILRSHMETAANPVALQSARSLCLAACQSISCAHLDTVCKLSMMAARSSLEEVREAAGQELRGRTSLQRTVRDALLDHIGRLFWFDDAFSAVTRGSDRISAGIVERVKFCDALMASDFSAASEPGDSLFGRFASEPYSASLILALAEQEAESHSPLRVSRASRAAMSVLAFDPVGAVRVLSRFSAEQPLGAAVSTWTQLLPLYVNDPSLRKGIAQIVRLRREELLAFQNPATSLLAALPGTDAEELGSCIALARRLGESTVSSQILDSAESRLLELLAAALRGGIRADVRQALAGAQSAGLKGERVDEATSFVAASESCSFLCGIPWCTQDR